ncbi:MAG: DUF6440 family protein [Clostridiales bacterium]|nr:DUF6440 family protein [Clostridiales bacterium]
MAKEKRFEVIMKEGSELGQIIKIFRDKETGVHYVYVGSGYGGGLTPLLDKEGKPVINR